MTSSQLQEQEHEKTKQEQGETATEKGNTCMKIFFKLYVFCDYVRLFR